MTAPARAPAVRTSPLRERHRALGAEWLSATLEWPRRYAGATSDTAALGGLVWLSDVGPLDKLLLQGERLSPPPPGPQHLAASIADGPVRGVAAQLWGLGPRESLLLVPQTGADSAAALLSELRAGGLTVEDQSSQYVALRVGGPAARRLLAGLSPLDLSDGALADRAVTFGTLALVRVIVSRLDHRGSPAFTILAERDYAVYLWDALMHAGAALGIEPVGAAALEGN